MPKHTILTDARALAVRLLQIHRRMHYAFGLLPFDHDCLTTALDILGVPPEVRNPTDGPCPRHFFKVLFYVTMMRRDDPETFVAVAANEIECDQSSLSSETLEERLYPKPA